MAASKNSTCNPTQYDSAPSSTTTFKSMPKLFSNSSASTSIVSHPPSSPVATTLPRRNACATGTNMTFKHWPTVTLSINDDGYNSLITASDPTTPNHKQYNNHQGHQSTKHHQYSNQAGPTLGVKTYWNVNTIGGNGHISHGFNATPKRNDSSSSNSILSGARLTASVTNDSGAASNEHVENVNGHNSGGSFIKPSLSMTSLPAPANESHQENKEVIKAKLQLERPYNSLKKKRNSDRDIWRHSWGSGHSQSSCSLHSNATGVIGKDEFWAALQTNYNYIMDTNLLDTCREARYEIEGNTIPNISPADCCGKILQSPRIEAISDDPRELRKWLRDMENKLSTAPSLLEATQLSIEELQRRLNDHSVLYCEIVSHARVVGACVKAATKIDTTPCAVDQSSSTDNSFNSLSSAEEKLQGIESFSTSTTTPTQTETETSPTTSPKISTQHALQIQENIAASSKRFDNLKSLERRYHLLYLKAIEVQCLFEGLLKKKNSEITLNEDYPSNDETETDDEPVSKLARLSDSECSSLRDLNTSFGNTLNENIYCHPHHQVHIDYNKSGEYYEDRDEEAEDNITPRRINEVDEVDCSLDFIREWQNYSLNSSQNTTTTKAATALNPSIAIKSVALEPLNIFGLNDSNTEFDADSEGSEADEIGLVAGALIRKRQKRVNLSAGCISKNHRQQVAHRRRLSHSPFNNIRSRNDFYPLNDFEKDKLKIKNSAPSKLRFTHNMDSIDILNNSNGGGVSIGTPLVEQNAVVVQNTTVYDCNGNSPNQHDKKAFSKSSNHYLNRSPNSISIGINTICHGKNKLNGSCVGDENLLDICNGNTSSCGDSSIIGPQRVSTPITPVKLNSSQNTMNDGTEGSDGAIAMRRQRNDASKFNRSNRKSKNCAIFYFKHLDTDNETNFGISSQGENELPNGEPSSSGDDEEPMEDDFYDDDVDEIDDCWLYTNNQNIDDSKSAALADLMNRNANTNSNGQQQLSTDDSDKENKEVSFVERIAGADTSHHNHRDANGNVQDHRPSPIRSTVPVMNGTRHEIQYHKFSSSARMITTTTVTTVAKPNCAELIIVENSDTEYHNVEKEDSQSQKAHLIDANKNDTTSSIMINSTASTTVTASSGGGSSSTEMTQVITKEESLSTSTHDSIKQLVLDAENLVREDCMRTPTKKSGQQRTPKTPRSHLKVPKTPKSTVKKRDPGMPGPNIQRVHEWLEHQPMSPKKEQRTIFVATTDCEASGENTESDTGGPHESDTSEGLTDSVATCMQTGGSTSHCTSTEIIGGSAEPILPQQNGSNLSLNNKVIRRTIQNRRNSDRPWSVSCISQLTAAGNTNGHTINAAKTNDVQSGLASHSISESALHVLSSPSRNANGMGNKNSPHHTPVKNSDSKNSLKRKKIRRRKPSSSTKKSDSGSEGLQAYDLPKLTESLLHPEKISTEQMTIFKDLSAALSMIQVPKIASNTSPNLNCQEVLSDEDLQNLAKPNFKIGPYTSAHMANEAKLGSLAALANYMNEDGECNTGTDEHNSSFSEQAWDNYQEKYNSENYSEGFDSDAARRLLEFGDDYRAFLDSQSDCCSSLSAANNLDSLSPPRMDSLTNNQPAEIKLTQETITSSVVDHARRRRTLELEYERRRRTLEMKRKSSQDNILALNNSPCSPTVVSTNASANAVTPKNNESYAISTNTAIANRSYPRSAAVEAASRRLDFDAMTSIASATNTLAYQHHNGSNNKKTSESDTSLRRRSKPPEDGVRRRSRNLEKAFRAAPYSSESPSSNSESEDEKEVNNLIKQSRNTLENTEALKIRSHLLRPEDYTEIIATCRDNIHCLNTVIHGTPGTVLSAGQQTQIRDLLSSWETFLAWSGNAGAARKMQEEMFVLKTMLNRLGCKQLTDLDSESAIQLSIDELKNEKSDLQAYRTNMLRLNASVHSWLTRHEMKVQKEVKALRESNDLRIKEMKQQEHQHEGDGSVVKDLVKGEQQQQQQQQKQNEVVVMTAEHQSLDNIIQSENEFHKHLKDEVSEMYKAWDEADTRINTKLETLQSSLNAWRQLENGLSEFHQVLGKDRGTLEGLEGALEQGRSNGDLAQNVKLVAKLLSERTDTAKLQIAQVAQEQQIDAHQLIHITRFAASNGSLSDSGISDGGTTSDGGLSERERRLGVLRRLAKQLESALAPGSEALKSISARMEAAEAELKKLQTTCREIIVRTAVQQQNKATATMSIVQEDGKKEPEQVNAMNRVQNKLAVSGVEDISPTKSAKKRKARKYNKNGLAAALGDSDSANNELSDSKDESKKSDRRNKISAARRQLAVANGGSGDPDDPKANGWDPCNSSEDESEGKRSWSWRVARVALPMQLALLTLFCAACFMQPHCCDSFNNFSMSFTPQLRYVRGPPPI